MKRNIIETVLGAVVLVVAAVFLVYSTQSSDAGTVDGYDVSVAFNDIGGLQKGDDVRISGVKIGTIDDIALDGVTYRARVSMSIDNDVNLPVDTAARISSKGLMGGNYLALDPGGDEKTILDNGTIQYSQDAQNLETLLGKFIFSMSGDKDEKTEDKSVKAAPASEQVMTPSGPSPAVEADSALPKM